MNQSARRRSFILLSSRVILAILAVGITTSLSHAQNPITSLYPFSGGADGANPLSTLTHGPDGTLYGTTYGGGVGTCFDGQADGCGVVFKVDSKGNESSIYSFLGAPDGAMPAAGLLLDSKGRAYGTTSAGGSNTGCFLGSLGCGAIFRVNANGRESVLYSFKGGIDGSMPVAGLIEDAAGNLYGTTQFGGDTSCFSSYGCGVVFKLDTQGNETVLHTFTGGTDGGFPLGSLVQDLNGNLYGTTSIGGDLSCMAPNGCGVVFKLDSSGQETIIHTFSGPPDGATPSASVLLDANGNIYGTTRNGGNPNCYSEGTGCGTVFKITVKGNTERVLYSFTGEPDGAFPVGAVAHDSAGNLYGTTLNGGSDFFGGIGFGVIFEIGNDGKEVVLSAFSGLEYEGCAYPAAAPIFTSGEKLAGTTQGGGNSETVGAVYTYTLNLGGVYAR